MKGIVYIEHFIKSPGTLYQQLKETINWDDRMKTRKTASFGVAYNYSEISYPNRPFGEAISRIAEMVKQEVGFMPNNCLVNYYPDGNAKMGYHSDQVEELEEGKGIIVISLGETRVLRFRRINNKEEQVDFLLRSGSLLYMDQCVQRKWQHAIPKSGEEKGRISLTFRRIKEERKQVYSCMDRALYLR